mmetsp:Transcript_37227/g.54829  ORF Transcript_37227/g.54829 Transcript_37227/m.54829 type:complete len:278 (+) Transcript_37227:42-875(+)
MIFRPTQQRVRKHMHCMYCIVIFMLTNHLHYALSVADRPSQSSISSPKQEQPQEKEWRTLEEKVTITFDDFENGKGSYETGPTNAKLVDRPGDEQHTPGGSSIMKITGIRESNDPDNTASFYHKQDHDVSSYFDVRVNFFFLTPSDNDYDRGDSFVLEASSNSGKNWTELERWTMDEDSFKDDDRFYEADVTIERSKIEFTENFRLRFRSNAGGSKDRLYIDDIAFSGKMSRPSQKPTDSTRPTHYPSRFPTSIPSEVRFGSKLFTIRLIDLFWKLT